MNPMTNVKNVLKLSERELTGNSKTSWHDQYKDSAWIFVGGLPYDLTEGDVICVFSQYGEIVNINLVRDKATGKSKGFAFICYEDQRSTILAVDNLNSIKDSRRYLKSCQDHVLENADFHETTGHTNLARQPEILGRTLRVDHCEQYRAPNADMSKVDEVTAAIRNEGCAPTAMLPPPTPVAEVMVKKEEKPKKRSKDKKSKKKKKKKKRNRSSSSGSSSSD